ncbi:MAG: hypothetical protein ACFFAS_11305 [Promethearchaeota archaeon]
MAEMLTDLLNAIYNRIAQLGVAIQDLKNSLDGLNKNIDEKIANLSDKISTFSSEIETTQTSHLEVLTEVGKRVTQEFETLQNGLGLEAFNALISNLENFSSLAEEVLNQESVNLLLSEAIESVKTLKEQGALEEEQAVEE